MVGELAAEISTAGGTASGAARLVDCDVHHLPRHNGELTEYLPERWRTFVDELPGGLRTIAPPARLFDHPDGVNTRLEAIPDDGPAGSDYELMREQLLDPYGVRVAHLNWGSNSGVANGELASALCVAENDWCREQWLSATGDERLYASVTVPMHDPEFGAAEIRRAGADPRFVSALLHFHPFSRPIGHRVYEPIFEAAAELDLPIYLHVNAGEHYAGTGPMIGGGSSTNYRFEVFMGISQPTATHLLSMIVHGVFERFSGLNVLIAEDGLAWFPAFAARLDSLVEVMRRESSWVRRLPSEYFRDHVFLTTQPSEATRGEADALIPHLRTFEGIERMICFSSDYPHWDSDAVSYIESVFPKEWHEGVFHENACRVLRLEKIAGSASRTATAGVR